MDNKIPTTKEELEALRKQVVEISDDELDDVAGGCGGHSNSNGKGHYSHGKGHGKGHDKNGCGCEEETASEADAGINWTCPYCSQTVYVTGYAEIQAHIAACPKAPKC